MTKQTAQEAGLEKARAVLRRRRQFGREVEVGEQSLSPEIGVSLLPEWLKTVKLGTMLRWLPGVGPATVEKILGEVPILLGAGEPAALRPTPVPPSQQLSGLSYRQRVALSLVVEKCEQRIAQKGTK